MPSDVFKLKTYGYALPQTLIAKEPLKKRDEARLLVIERKKRSLIHDYFYNLGKYLPQKSLIITNDTRVIPARLLGRKERSGGNVEIFLLKRHEDGQTFDALLRPLKKIKEGDVVCFEKSHLKATILDREQRIVKFNVKDVFKSLAKVGHIPLPPYIKRPDNEFDRKDYQTVYAKEAGSVASPTAGLHFTKKLISDLKREGHTFLNVTLHINYATFKPVETEDIREHKMHTESYRLSSGVIDKIKQARKSKRSIVAVGTTSCRVLEAVAQNGRLKGNTNLFIYPGYRFKWVDTLITNFHLPFSSLLMLACAFGTVPLVKKAYDEAIKKGYRFYSYGDCMLIL